MIWVWRSFTYVDYNTNYFLSSNILFKSKHPLLKGECQKALKYYKIPEVLET